MFKAFIGDLFASKAQTLVNTVNCVGVMGKGIALEFKKRFPSLFEDYADRCGRGEVRIGEPYLYRGDGAKQVLNFPTKGHWRSPSRLADIADGLDHFVKHYKAWGITSIAFPRLGCGNGGLEWAQVGPLMYDKLHRLPIEMEVYAPYGTPRQELAQIDVRDVPRTSREADPREEQHRPGVRWQSRLLDDVKICP
jgi:O-acetyl-ADP-ribose deacetylase (regulator of RNase III)